MKVLFLIWYCVNRMNFWSPIAQVSKLFGTYHLLGFITDTLGYNLYIAGYVQQVPQYPSSYSNILIHFLSKFFNFQKNNRITRAAVPLRNVWSTIFKERNKCSILWYHIFGWFLPWLFSINHLTLALLTWTLALLKFLVFVFAN